MAPLADWSGSLAQLCEGLAPLRACGPQAQAEALHPRGLANHSARVAPGDLFIGIAGQRSDGRRYLQQAAERGAVAALVELDTEHPAPGPSAGDAVGLPVFTVPGLRALQGPLADRFHGSPSRQLRMIGITGTNAKTSVSRFIAQALPQTAVIGTEGAGVPPALERFGMTTPDPLDLQRLLRDFVDQGVRQVAMEVSSHALDQHRVDGVRFEVAVFTNLGHDHLDYHGDLASYGAAKARLFEFPGLRAAVLNVDDDFVAALAARLPAGIARHEYGRHAGRTQGRAQLRGLDGLRLLLREGDWQQTLDLPLLGRFSLYNVLAAFGVLRALGLEPAAAAAALARLEPVPGRMEVLRQPVGPVVVVDYAHNPPALEQVLRALREHLEAAGAGALWCVFGCGGDRDRAKRPLMGRVAARLADRVVLTDDNPRSEDPAAIVREVLAGIAGPLCGTVIHDRAEAIQYAIRHARPGDLVLIAGKGAELNQTRGNEVLPFDDRAVARAALEAAA